MPTGKCPLCDEEKLLRDSHFMPAALRDFCSFPGGHPIVVTPDIIIESDRMLHDYVFCADCEDIFNKGGETWVLTVLARLDAPFPLYDMLVKQAPAQEDGDSKLYAAARNPEIRTDKLIHFAMGIFFKGAVHSWSGTRTEPWINLGPYAEPLRTFLLGKAPFPARMCLTLGVLPWPTRAIEFCYPYRDSTEGKFNYRFNACGVQFVLEVGRTVTPEARTACFGSSPFHPILLADFASNIQLPFREAFQTTRIAKNVEKWLKKS
jgi:hypothetical protein